MNVEVRRCTLADVERIRSTARATTTALWHHEERWSWQEAGSATYLLAWNDGDVIGRATLLRRSKYELVRSAIGDAPEVNALDSTIPGQGVGTRIMACAEQEAISWGAAVMGLGVSPGNTRARRLYARLGFVVWDRGTVCDQWIERDRSGAAVAERADECLYLTKRLTA
jgi:GNAT superfamily N-acetyltransferase